MTTPVLTVSSNRGNMFCSVSYSAGHKSLTVRDLTDMYNEPVACNRTVRGLPKAWAEVLETFSDETKFRDVVEIMVKHKIRIHQWCAVD